MTHFSLSPRPSRSLVRRHLRMLAVASALIVSSSCDGLGDGPNVSGFWIGYDGDRRVRLQLGEVDEEVTGSGDISAPGRKLELGASTHIGDEVILDIIATHDDFVSFGLIDGNLQGDILTARLSGAAFNTEQIVLRRMP